MLFGMSQGTREEIERLNAEILFWKSETDKRKVQLGEYLLDDPCDPGDDSLWQKHAACEVEAARERLTREPGCALALVMALVRDKQAFQVCVFLCGHSLRSALSPTHRIR